MLNTRKRLTIFPRQGHTEETVHTGTTSGTTQYIFWETNLPRAYCFLNLPLNSDLRLNLSAYGYGQAPSWQSSYQPNQFAQSIFQQTIAASTYPTPPPPGISMSSSSLAFALQERPAPPPPKTVYDPRSSNQFFDQFVTRKTQEMEAMSPATPSRSKSYPTSGSDPLAVITPHVALSPTKRKSVEQMESPSVKRIHSLSSMKKSLSPVKERNTERTPVSRVGPFKHKQEVYVELPPVHNTPTSQKRVKQGQTSRDVEMEIDGSEDDLGGYGSEEAGVFRRPRSSSVTSVSDGIKSSAKRTGDRDDRGISAYSRHA